MTDDRTTQQDEDPKDQAERVEDLEVTDEASKDVQGGNPGGSSQQSSAYTWK